MAHTMSDLEVAVAGARAGASALMAHYGSDLSRSAKGAIDFATEADLASERAILEVIRKARPEDGFVGEELGTVTAGVDGRTWLVDPLCGTLNYAAHTSAYSVNVALVGDGGTAVAAVTHPPTGEVYCTDGVTFEARRTSGATAPAPNLLVDVNADGPLDRPFIGAELAADPAFRSRFAPRISSTTLALAWVASGHRLGYVTDGTHVGSVHFAAPLAVCQAAGCIVTDFDGAPVHTGRGIVAAADHDTHSALLELVSSHRTD